MGTTFLYSVFTAPQQAHNRTMAKDGFNRASLFCVFDLVYEHAIKALREFSKDVYYTQFLDEGPTCRLGGLCLLKRSSHLRCQRARVPCQEARGRRQTHLVGP
jgi:hypothetical protein